MKKANQFSCLDWDERLAAGLTISWKSRILISLQSELWSLASNQYLHTSVHTLAIWVAARKEKMWWTVSVGIDPKNPICSKGWWGSVLSLQWRKACMCTTLSSGRGAAEEWFLFLFINWSLEELTAAERELLAYARKLPGNSQPDFLIFINIEILSFKYQL